MADFLPYWAERRGTNAAFRERDAQGAWRTITWTELWHQVQAVGAALLELGLGQDRPLMLLSGNSIEQAVVLLAAECAGVPAAAVSPACLPSAAISRVSRALRRNWCRPRHCSCNRPRPSSVPSRPWKATRRRLSPWKARPPASTPGAAWQPTPSCDAGAAGQRRGQRARCHPSHRTRCA
ncbi:AMP-binding protein [Cupriavidus basilensis]